MLVIGEQVWVSRDLAEAVRQTVPPLAIDWYGTPLPFEGAVFMLPKGLLRHRMTVS